MRILTRVLKSSKLNFEKSCLHRKLIKKLNIIIDILEAHYRFEDHCSIAHVDKLQKVLLVDDDDIVNSINKVIIKHAKFANEIISETIASKAIEYIKQQREEASLPDLIFLDINMPEMDGWDFIDEFVKLGFDDDGPRIIMLTSSINPRDENRASLIDVITDFMSKPLSPELLDKIYEQHFQPN